MIHGGATEIVQTGTSSNLVDAVIDTDIHVTRQNA